MNKLAASVLVMFSLFASCTSDNFTSPSPTEDQRVTIGFGDIVFLKPNLRAGFKSLLSDSRCPRNAECLWTGIANIEIFLLRPASDSIVVPLGIYGGVAQADTAQQLSRDTIGLRLTLLQLDPYPEVDSVFTPSRYRALLRIVTLPADGAP